MVITDFSFASLPHIEFGAGKYNKLISELLKYGHNVLIMIGGKSFKASGKLEVLEELCKENSINMHHISVKNEPSPDLIDQTVDFFKNKKIDVVVAIGGGSVIDAGKAVSAMLTKTDTVKNYLEGVGDKIHDGQKVPFIAIPTTAGTGSETTKNAVLSEVGQGGYKKSLRHDNFIPDVAIIDPELMLNCPKSITAATGLDAFAQLLESYVSTGSSAMTDALALSGLEYFVRNFSSAYNNGMSDLNARTAVAYAAMLSGITLANAGLGIVHGVASAIGGYFDIPHGVICGTLTAEAIKINVEKLINNNDQVYIKKYAKVGSLFTKETLTNDQDYCEVLINSIQKWINDCEINCLGKYGVTEDYLDKIIEKSSNKNNPVKLSSKEIYKLIQNRL